jgi:hypothetical protein
MTTNVITFGAGSQNYIEAGLRLCNQAKKMGVFNNISLFTEECLKQDTEFWERHSEFILRNSRGYGYWLWKPYIIQKTMKSLNDGDILLYLDSGCEMDIRKKKEMLHYFDLIKTEQIITAFTFTEKRWNKMDLILYLNCHSKEFTDTAQRQAGAILFFVCDSTRSLINEWYDTACNYHFIDDSPSESQNFEGFSEHRHDQSIFSLLTKKKNFCNTFDIRNIIVYERNRSGNARY